MEVTGIVLNLKEKSSTFMVVGWKKADVNVLPEECLIISDKYPVR
jgi:hypothetical protein